jgi:UDP-N-acetylglucosamine enolpyruvyl transferase
MKLGAKFNYSQEDGGIYEVDASHLQGAYMLLDEASVTGTANIVMVLYWQKVQPLFTTLLVSLICNSCVKC